MSKLCPRPLWNKFSVHINGIIYTENIANTATRSVFLEESDLSLIANNSDYSANPLKVQCFLSASTGDDETASARQVTNTRHQFIQMIFQNNAPQVYITDNSDNEVVPSKFVTKCDNVTATVTAAGSTRSTINYTCPDGEVVSHQCTNDKEIITTVCSAIRRLPVCRILSSNDNDAPTSCDLVSFTKYNMTCNCSILLELSTTGADNSDRRHLRGVSTVESSGYIEVVSMAEYSYDGFISTSSEFTEISVGGLKSGLIVIVMFATLWGCGVLGLYELFKRSYCTCCSKVLPSDMSREGKVTDALVEASIETKKEHVLQYLEDILPTMFRSSVKHETTLQSMWRTIKTYHPYAVVFTPTGPEKKDIRIQKWIYLLTIQAMLMFVMAVLCDLQVYICKTCSVSSLFLYCFVLFENVIIFI